MAKRIWIDFEEVRQKCPLPDVMAEIGILDQFEQKKPNHYQGVCPLPQHQHKSPVPNPEQFKFDLKNGQWLFYCHGDCQTGGGVIEFIKLYYDYDDAQTRLWIHQHFADRLQAVKPDQKKRDRPKRKETPDQNGQETETNKKEDAAPTPKKGVPAPQESKATSPNIQPSILSSLSSAHKLKPLRFSLRLTESEYLAKRGVTPETIKRFGLGHCAKYGNKKKVLEGYAVFPVTLPVGGEWKTVAYFGRYPGEDYSEEVPKYKWPGEGIQSQCVLGLQQALEDSDSPNLILVQSPFDLFHLRQNGFSNVVALTRPELTEEQAELLARTNKQVVLFFHGDEHGYKGMRLAAAKLITRCFVQVIRKNDGQPSHLPKKQLANSLLI